MIRIGEPAAADALVEAQRREGYDFIKVYNLLAPPVFDAIVAAASRRGMQVAGLSPYQALCAATAAPAEFLGGAGDFGTLVEGGRADLLLLDGNPLDDVVHAGRPIGVMARGRWLPAAQLRRMLDDIAARNAGARAPATDD